MRGFIVYSSLFIVITVTVLLLTTNSQLSTAHAQVGCSGAVPARVVDGLVSAPNIASQFFSNLGTCVTGVQAAYVPFKIPTYDELKVLFYDQASQGVNKIQLPASSNFTSTASSVNYTQENLIYIPGDFTIDLIPLQITKSQVYFVQGSLRIANNWENNDPNVGIVFVVKGPIYISPDPNPTLNCSPLNRTCMKVDAMLISDNQICTATATALSSSCPTQVMRAGDPGFDVELVISGGLISLNKSTPIIFRRNLANNRRFAAEVINAQPKFFPALKNTFSQTLNIVSEDTNFGPP